VSHPEVFFAYLDLDRSNPLCVPSRSLFKRLSPVWCTDLLSPKNNYTTVLDSCGSILYKM